MRIYKTYGADVVQVITENPYRLARDIRGIGFRTADLVAQRLGIAPTAMIRVRAGISFALAEATGEGHCGLPLAELTAQTAALIEVPSPLIETALELELAEGEVVADTLEGERCIFLAGLYRAEQAIAERLRTLARGAPPWPAIDTERAIPWVEGRTGLSLAPSQREALSLATRSKVLVITGGPGVGKTTLLNFILRVHRVKGVEVALCAPTGRAARRLSDSRGLEARTIHNAHRINQGQMPELRSGEGSDFFFVDAADPEEGVRKLLTMVRERMPARFGLGPVRDVQVLCPMNRDGLGARSLNSRRSHEDDGGVSLPDNDRAVCPVPVCPKQIASLQQHRKLSCSHCIM